MAQLGAGSGTGYPTALDTASTEVDSPAAGKTRVRAAVANDLYAAVIAVQTELGVDVAGSAADLVTRLALSLEDTGYLKDIADSNGNELIKWTATSSAVNEVTIANAATGNNPSFTASGDDANIGINLVPKGTGAVQAAGTAMNVAGKQTMFVPASAMRATASNGCASITDTETTAGRPDQTVLAFDASSDEHAQFQVALPKSWNLGTVTFQVFWTSSATDTDGVAWGLQGVVASDGDTIDVAYGTAVVVTDDAQSTAEDLYVTAESAAITIAGTPADDDMAFFRVFRDVSDANDDMTEDALLIGIKFFFTTDLANDA